MTSQNDSTSTGTAVSEAEAGPVSMRTGAVMRGVNDRSKLRVVKRVAVIDVVPFGIDGRAGAALRGDASVSSVIGA